MIIFKPMKERIMANPYFSLLNKWMKLSRRKKRALNPSMANMLDVYRINGSLEMAKIAGIESTANSKSVNSMTATTTKRGVASFFPF